MSPSGGRLCVVGPLATHDEWMLPRPKPAFDDLPSQSMVQVDPEAGVEGAIRDACGGRLSLSMSASGTAKPPVGLCAELSEQPGRRLVHLVNYRADGPIRDVAVALGLPPGASEIRPARKPRPRGRRRVAVSRGFERGPLYGAGGRHL